MAGKSRPSAEKRRIDKLRQEQQAAKRERRHARERPAEGAGPGDGPSEEELYERFRRLNEARAAGTVTEEQFEPARHEIMVALGIEDPRPEANDEDADEA